MKIQIENQEIEISCIERKYEIKKANVKYVIAAKTTMRDDITGKLLHEDMELKTFLLNYDIVDVETVGVLDVPDVLDDTSLKHNELRRRDLYHAVKDVVMELKEFTSDDIASRIGCDVKNVRNHLKKMEKQGIIQASGFSEPSIKRRGRRNKLWKRVIISAYDDKSGYGNTGHKNDIIKEIKVREGVIRDGLPR